MYIVAIAWAFVVLLMVLAEATSTQGTLLGAFFTLLFYGVLPLSVVLYVMGTPARRRARRAREANEASTAGAQALESPRAGGDLQADSADPDGGSMPPGHPVPPEGEKI
jgi:membrane protein implicated in regulation of membrane protease activity